VRAHQADYPAATLCRVLQVSESGYYTWRTRAPSARARRDAELLTLIEASHQRSDATYGAPRVHEDLAEAGHRVGRKRVARLMRAAGLVGVSKTGAAPRPKRTTPETPQAPDLVQRDFTASVPNALWVADITYVPTYAGFLYLAVVLDAFSRRVVGWAMSSNLKTGVVLDALQMAATQRCPVNVVHHSDQGSQPGFNRSLQHGPVVQIVRADPGLRQGCASRASCAVAY
jgi:putative transposase